MNYSAEVEEMCFVRKGVDHGPAPIPEEGKWVQAKEIADLLSELDRLHSTPPHEPGAPWLHHVSSSLLHSLQRLERPEQ